MDYHRKNLVLQAFKRLLSGDIPDKYLGICNNVIILTRVDSYRYSHLFSSWPKYSGYLDFPIPVTNNKFKKPYHQFNLTKNLWIRKQGQLRRELLQHMITELEKEND